jgi:hypothetical protein
VVAGAAEVGAPVVAGEAEVAGAAVVAGASVVAGAAVVAGALVGAAVVAGALVGAAVVGAAVDGALVGAAVVGAAVDGAVVGGVVAAMYKAILEMVNPVISGQSGFPEYDIEIEEPPSPWATVKQTGTAWNRRPLSHLVSPAAFEEVISALAIGTARGIWISWSTPSCVVDGLVIVKSGVPPLQTALMKAKRAARMTMMSVFMFLDY